MLCLPVPHSFAVIPKIGALVANDAPSYEYLVESIRKFPDQVRGCCMNLILVGTFRLPSGLESQEALNRDELASFWLPPSLVKLMTCQGVAPQVWS